jgi:hypothetical protein
MTSRVKPWTVRGSRYLIRERWLTARIDDCVTPTGVEVQRSRKSRREDFVIVALGRLRTFDLLADMSLVESAAEVAA